MTDRETLALYRLQEAREPIGDALILRKDQAHP